MEDLSLESAIRLGHFGEFEVVMDQDPNLEAPVFPGLPPPLCYALENNRLDMARVLLDRGASVNLDKEARANLEFGGYAPVLAAVRTRQVEPVRWLADKGAELDVSYQGITPLSLAIGTSSVEIVRFLLERGADANKPLHAGTLLGAAAQKKNREIVQLLLDAGAKLGYDDGEEGPKGPSILDMAVESGSVEIASLLLERGAIRDLARQTAETPLVVAATRGRLEMAKLLFRHGWSVQGLVNDGLTPLSTAADAGEDRVVEWLISKGAKLDATTRGRTPLHRAAFNGHVRTMRLLADAGADIGQQSTDGSYPIHVAVLSGNWKAVRFLIKRGADIESKAQGRRTPLQYAADADCFKAAKCLLAHGARIDGPELQDYSPLAIAAKGGHLLIARLLLSKGADVHVRRENGWTPLHLAAHAGHVEVAYELLEHGADIEATDDHGSTPLLIAARYGQLAMLNMLQDRGANLHARGKANETPLLMAAKRGLNHHIVRRLITMGLAPHINTPRNEDLTPLLAASKAGFWKTAKVLLEYGADKEARGGLHQVTPLIAAVRSGSIKTVKLLLDHGAEIDVTDDGNLTPLNTAVDSGYFKMAELLLRRGANPDTPDIGGWTPLFAASASVRADRRLVEKLYRLVPFQALPLDKNNRSPVFIAALRGHLDILKLFLKKNLNLAFKADIHGSIPLSAAIRHGHAHVVMYLLSLKQVSLDAPDLHGKSLQYWLDRHGTDEIKLLFKALNQLEDKIGSPDLFRRVLKLWLEQLGEKDVKSFIRSIDPSILREEKAKKDGEVPKEVQRANDGFLSWCDVCTLNVLDKQPYFLCEICDNGRFVVCPDCVCHGVRCWDKSHELTFTTDEDLSDA